MLWFGEDISKNFDSQKEEWAHREAVLDSSLLKNEILALARADTFSMSDFHNLWKRGDRCHKEKKINVSSQWACL